MMWSGMRFADLQRTLLSSLAYGRTSLRGVSYRTKTCKSGCPFGLLCKGFLSTGSFTWVHRFLQELDSLYSGCGKQPQDIDFIIPSTDALESSNRAQPYDIRRSIFLLQTLFVIAHGGRPPMDTGMNAHHYTVHGLKSTLLSFADQLQLAPELRRLQGKHKDPLQSTRLYSRDDVSGALQLQESIISSVQKGWRQHTPLGRGGQIPHFISNKPLRPTCLIQEIWRTCQIPLLQQIPANLHLLFMCIRTNRNLNQAEQCHAHLMKPPSAFFCKPRHVVINSEGIYLPIGTGLPHVAGVSHPSNFQFMMNWR